MGPCSRAISVSPDALATPGSRGHLARSRAGSKKTSSMIVRSITRIATTALVATVHVHVATSAGMTVSEECTAFIDTSTALHSVDSEFLGVNVDSGSLTNRIDLSDPYLSRMTLQLATAGPATAMHLRVGGSASNGLRYEPTGAPGRCSDDIHSTCISDSSVVALDAFAKRAGARVTFCIPYPRDGDSSSSIPWDANPAFDVSAFWSMVAQKNLTSFSGWSLGNEVIGDKPGFNNTKYAVDYVAFRDAATRHAPTWAQAIVGPSAPGWPGDDIMRPFLSRVARLPQMSFSIHAYAFGRDQDTVTDYMNKTQIEKMAHYYSAAVAARDSEAPQLPVYLEEMATQAGGGAEGLSNRFVSGFWFLHALGLAGRMGIARVTRQDLAGWSFSSGVSHYTLVGPAGWVSTATDGLPTPHPDWYLALLWRQLMGDRVLRVDMNVSETLNETIAVHAWCSAAVPRLGVRNRDARGGSVTLGYLNLGKDSTRLHLGGGAASAAPEREEFFLTAPGGDMQADAVLLNGVPLRVGRDGVLLEGPRVRGRLVMSGAPLVLPPQSYGFVVLKSVDAPACLA